MNANLLPFSDATHIGVSDSSGDRIVPIDELRATLAVDALIRLHKREFDRLPRGCRHFVHFNLERTLNEVGRRYAVVPIIRAGARGADGKEVLPVVDPAPARIGICTEVIQTLPIEELLAKDFVGSLPHIQTKHQLEAALLSRYAKMFPNLSSRQILDRGVAITRIAFQH